MSKNTLNNENLPTIPKIIPDYNTTINKSVTKTDDKIKIVHIKGKYTKANRVFESILNKCFLCCCMCIGAEIND